MASSASASAAPAVAKLDRTVLRRVALDFSDDPLYFTASFDGSQRFGMWIDTLAFARAVQRKHGKRVRFSYFINTCYYDTGITGSWIGRAHSRDEVLVRIALTQQAINEGHEIGNHGVRHDNGLAWTAERWRTELAEFHALTERTLFRPVRDASGKHVFPRFGPVDGAPAGLTGARCESDGDCASNRCLPVTSEDRFCTQPCNRKLPCPAGTACGAPAFQDDTDVCVPLPRFPVVHEGEELFDASGLPNRKHPALRPYPIVGYRAPFLAFNDGLTEVLLERHYRYDASQLALPGPPLKIGLLGEKRALLGFALMQHRGTRTIPMDYNYRELGVTGERMAQDYRSSLLAAYSTPARYPWNVGHHFADWHDGAYWKALREAITFAAAGCPHDGALACPQVELTSFRRLARVVARKIRRRRK